ncbi:hypothetical protein E4U42_007057 [Claviceps africana]|uniref:Nucleoside phosphorylase domain-containing protein n=1 Tax=Claviceps africana TaxID=83212 RepID=A0A8K0J287_9HYPO|nr:hypothetical protein E4U42_007057 [Claviceps africana]
MSVVSVPRLALEDYTTGWICTRRVEHLAAVATLEQRHTGHVGYPRSDHNTYVLGSIQGLNIIITLIPVWETGSPSASYVAKRMKMIFPKLDAIFLVGIGSGVPGGKDDVRLGDVVVSTDTMVPDCDVFQNMANGANDEFRVPPLPRDAQPGLYTRLISNSTLELNTKGIGFVVSDVQRRGSEAAHLFMRPASSSDVKHEPLPSTTPGQPNDVVKVHKGRIATGNKLIKTANLRDSISKSLGGVLCFDTFASDMMDQLPCLVIRGIGDYADGHIDTEWHNYAAAVAAAYAKAVIMFLASNMAEAARRKETRVQAQKAGTRKDAAAAIQQNGKFEAHWLVPFSRNKRFSGREPQLHQLQEWSSFPDSCRRMAISGLGGMGKSQIALEFAYRTKARNPRCSVFWVPANDLASFEEAFLKIGRLLRVPGLDVYGADVKQLVKDALSNDKTLGPWLMVVDDIDEINAAARQPSDKEMRSPMLTDYIPFSLNGAVLFTTKNRQMAVKQAANNTILLEEMTWAEAEILLRKSLLQPQLQLMSDTKARSELLCSLEFLPLAIMQAVAYINQNGMSIAEYTKLIKNHDVFIDMLGQEFEDEGRCGGTKSSILRTWLASISQMGRTNPLAVEYLSLMACLCPWDIPQYLLAPSRSEKQGLDAIGLLTAYSLIKKRPGEQMFDMHLLVYVVTRHWLESESTMPSWNAKAISYMGEVISEVNNAKSPDDARFHEICPHALQLLRKSMSTIGAHWEAWIFLAEKVAEGLEKAWDFGLACQTYGDVLELSIEKTGPESARTWKTRVHMARLLIVLGEYKQAEAQLWPVFELAERVSMDDGPENREYMGLLAKAVRLDGRFAEARRIHEEHVARQIERTHADHDDVIGAETELAFALIEHGSVNEAEAIFRQLLVISLRTKGEMHPQTLRLMWIVASVQTEKLDEAEGSLRRAIALQGKVVGEKHTDTVQMKRSLAEMQYKRGNYEEAWSLTYDAWRTSQELLGSHAAPSIQILEALAELCQSRGQLHEAIGIHQKAVNMWMERFKPESKYSLKAISRLAEAMRLAGRETDADAVQEGMVALRNSEVGAEDLAKGKRRSMLNGLARVLGR